MRWLTIPLVWIAFTALAAADANRLTYLDELNPYYPGRGFPKLTTPQWVGEDGVEAVVILAIDDMRDAKKYETFLRPILTRLKKIDGRAPVSIMTNQIDPKEPQLQEWLKEGLSLETHTFDHPCPLLKDGHFPKAKATYDRCVDLLADVPNSKPVAFRMPCCDSLNTPSPRFYAEIFNQKTPSSPSPPEGEGRVRGDHFLSIDTSVFNIFTSKDPELPKELVLDDNGKERFKKYVPYDRSFVNTIEDYPYPYVIGRLCWQFPCVTPSDWQAQHLHKPNNAITVRDWQAALDATVKKQGVFCLVFHPHGWIQAEQIVALIDHAVDKHGKKVKFLTFKEAQERLDRHLLGGMPIRNPKTGEDNKVRVLDLNNDGYVDVVIGNGAVRQTRLWLPKENKWQVGPFPADFQGTADNQERVDHGIRFGVFRKDGQATCFFRSENGKGAYHFDGSKWINAGELFKGLETEGLAILTAVHGADLGFRFRDLDGDGVCEAISSNLAQANGLFQWSEAKKSWAPLPFHLPPGAYVVNPNNQDGGVRFVDLNDDGKADVVFSNERVYGVYLFNSMKDGWSKKTLAGQAGTPGALPVIALLGQNMGAWFHSRHLWVQNENTSLLPNLVDRRSYEQLLGQVEPKKP